MEYLTLILHTRIIIIKRPIYIYVHDLINFYHNFIFLVREHLKDLTKQYDKSESDLKALQSVGQVCYKSYF